MILIFVFGNYQNSFSCPTPSPSFGPFWSTKYLNFGDESCEIRILPSSTQEIYEGIYMRESKKKNRSYFLYRFENQICQISWSVLASQAFQNHGTSKTRIKIASHNSYRDVNYQLKMDKFIPSEIYGAFSRCLSTLGHKLKGRPGKLL